MSKYLGQVWEPGYRFGGKARGLTKWLKNRPYSYQEEMGT